MRWSGTPRPTSASISSSAITSSARSPITWPSGMSEPRCAAACPDRVWRTGAGQGTRPRRSAASWFSELVRDVRVGFRGLRREPLFALSVTIILTVAIGASVAMFSVLHTVVLRALPYPRANELAMIRTHLMLQNQPDGTSLPNWFDWRRESKTFAGMTFYFRTAVSAVTFAGREAPQRGQAGLVGPDFFEVVGSAPLIGRTPSSDDFDRRDRVVVLSEGSGRSSSRDLRTRSASRW